MSEQAVIDYWSSVKEIIDRVCEGYDALWQRRSRVLNSKIVVIMVFKLILSDFVYHTFLRLSKERGAYAYLLSLDYVVFYSLIFCLSIYYTGISRPLCP